MPRMTWFMSERQPKVGYCPNTNCWHVIWLYSVWHSTASMLLLFSALLGCFLIKVEIYKPLIDLLAPEGKLVCWMRKAKGHVAITVKCKFSGCLSWMLFTIQVLPVDYGIGQELILVTKGADGKLEQEVCYLYALWPLIKPSHYYTFPWRVSTYCINGVEPAWHI